jgi:hypothetical protein
MLDREDSMLKEFAAIAGIVVVVVAVLIVYATTLPNEFRIARSVTIKAPPGQILPLINELKSFNQRNPFARQDPTTAIV